MPKEQPTAADVWQGDIAFFSLDTEAIQGAGYSFDEGPLNLLPKQLPPAMHLKLTEVVAQEIVRHRMKPVLEAIARFEGASRDLHRLARLDMAAINSIFESSKALDFATTVFRKEIEDYVARCRGSILAIEDGLLATTMFARYFSTQPPFENKKDKKNEFPDAAALLLLEGYGETVGKRGIVVSADAGWKNFADTSDFLHCVRSIDDLAALFAATDAHAQSIKQRVLAALEDEGSALHQTLVDSLHQHFGDASWEVDDIYSGVVHRVEGEPYDADVVSYELLPEKTSIWVVEEDRATWVVEVTARVKVQVAVSVSYFVWDSIDKEEMELTSDTVRRDTEIKVSAFISVSNVDAADSREWDVDVEIAPGEYSIDVGEVEPDVGE